MRLAAGWVDYLHVLYNHGQLLVHANGKACGRILGDLHIALEHAVAGQDAIDSCDTEHTCTIFPIS